MTEIEVLQEILTVVLTIKWGVFILLGVLIGIALAKD